MTNEFEMKCARDLNEVAVKQLAQTVAMIRESQLKLNRATGLDATTLYNDRGAAIMPRRHIEAEHVGDGMYMWGQVHDEWQFGDRAPCHDHTSQLLAQIELLKRDSNNLAATIRMQNEHVTKLTKELNEYRAALLKSQQERNDNWQKQADQAQRNMIADKGGYKVANALFNHDNASTRMGLPLHDRH